MRFLEPFAGLTDEALAELASTGLLRRARKLADDVAETGTDAKGADLTVGGHAVRVDARGPAAVTCECPTGGVCVHVVVACRWARDRAAALGVEPPSPQEATTSGGGGRNGRSPGEATGPGNASPEARKPARRGTRRAGKEAAGAGRRREAAAEVRDVVVHVLDGGLAHLRDDAPESLRALAGRVRVAAFEPLHGLRLDALLRTAAGQAADLAAHDDNTTEADLLTTLTEIWAWCEAREHLERDGGGAAAPPGGPTAASGRTTTKPTKRRSGRDEDETDLARLVPLGVRWWTGASGSRGVTFAAWDPDEGRVRTAVTGRPAGSDPSFRRDWEIPLLWGLSPARLSAGPFGVSAVRVRTDGTLGAGGNPRITGGGEFGLDELREVAERTGGVVPARDVVGFGRRPSHVRLLLVRDSGDIGIDEVRQDLTWTVTDSTGDTHLLRVPVSDRRTADTLLHVLAGRWSVVAVTTERHDGRTEPVGLYLRGNDGAIRLVSPSITEEYELTRGSRWSSHTWEAWRRRMTRVAGMRRRAGTVTQAAEPDPPVVRACGLAWDVTVALAATGRRRLTARQRSDADHARTLARDLGLTTLERALADLVREPGTGFASADAGRTGHGGPEAGRADVAAEVTPEALARAAFLIHRTREVATAT